VLFKLSSIEITITALTARCLHATFFNSSIKGVSQQSLKAKEGDQNWESKSTVANEAYLIRQYPIIL